jgi:(1->4)-alpha-D-glucan 1-alpha-D-glucosylmutase
VDYEHRRALLRQACGSITVQEVWSRADEGLPKLWLTKKTLDLRARFKEAFGPGATYHRLETFGSKADHLVAFERSRRVITLAPRLMLKLNNDWQDTSVRLPAGTWRNAFTTDALNGTVQAAQLFQQFPVALLYRED